MRRRHRFSTRSLSSVSEIDITPLIDLAFSLLIIFMISTPLLEQTVPLSLPSESARPQVESMTKPEVQIISMDLQGHLFWGKESVTKAVLKERLMKLAGNSKPLVIHLRADAGLAYGQVMDVVDWIKEAGLSHLSLDTQVK